MSQSLSNIVFLGPQGSYTHSALSAQYSCTDSKGLDSIARVFDAVVEGSALYGCIPLENMLEGPVAETFDSLLAHRNKVTLVDSFTASIDHCLGALSKDASVVNTIYSHSQALRQCASFLDTNYPKARRISCPSTAAAAARVAVDNDPQAAAIASEKTLINNGLELLNKSINNVAGNKTRFAIIAAADAKTPWSKTQALTNYTTSIAMDPGRDRQGILQEMLQVISVEHHCNITSIHSRPDQRGGFVFFLDIEGHSSQPHVQGALDGLESFCRDTTGQTARLSCFGSYRSEPFHSLPFAKIGIIGAKGAMGSWFSNFFKTLGLETIECDLDSDTSLEEVVSNSEVVIISTPMSEVTNISKKLAKLVSAGQLIVENASIKSSSVPVLEDVLPDTVELLGIHTMFGQSINSLRDQNIIITKTKSSGKKAQAFEDLLYKQGARLFEASIEEHDKASASLQALIHLLLISTAGVLEDEWGEAKNLESFTTPNARPLLTAMARVLRQSDSLLHDMQLLNPQSENIRHKILSELCKHVFSIDQGDMRTLDATLRRARKFFEN